MTEPDRLETTAGLLAERGREALLARLRPAFAEAARAHADILELGTGQLEQMVKRAADRADGLQWRRALAGVATEELGIGLGEALCHPAVERAQSILGAPSYEESLAQLGEPPASNGSAQEEIADRPSESPARPAEASAPGRASGDAGRNEDEEFQERAAEAPQAAERLRLPAVHLNGIATLEPGEEGIELRMGDPGLDIVRRSGLILGRLHWREIKSLEVSLSRGLLRRRRHPHLVIRAEHGDASFEIRAATADELRAQLDPVVARCTRP